MVGKIPQGTTRIKSYKKVQSIAAALRRPNRRCHGGDRGGGYLVLPS